MKLKEARAARYLTIRRLAEMAKVSPGTIQAIEGGRSIPTLTTAGKLAHALDVDPNEVDEFRAAVEKTLEGRQRETP